jgi:hypothetical protein
VRWIIWYFHTSQEEEVLLLEDSECFQTAEWEAPCSDEVMEPKGPEEEELR